MKKLLKYFLAGGVIVGYNNLSAQADTFWNNFDTTQIQGNYLDIIDQTFGTLDTQYYPSGILYNRVPGNPFIYSFSGSDSDTAVMTWDKWFIIYNEMLYAKKNKPDFPEFIELYDTCYKQYLFTNTVNLGLLNFNFHKIREDAIDSGWIQVVNDKLYDVSGRTVNPYVEHRVFSVLPLIDTIRKSTVQFKIDTNYIFSNDNDTILFIEADFGDGAGIRTLVPGNIISINYSSSGNSELQFTIHFSSGKKLYSSSTIYVFSDILPTFKKDGGSDNILATDPIVEFEIRVLRRGDCPVMDADLANNSTLNPANAIYAYAKVGIWYSCFADPYQPRIRKPVIFATGYDALQNASFGLTNKMIKNYENINDKGHNLLDALRAEGADVIIIDVKNGADCVENYSLLIEELLNKINGSFSFADIILVNPGYIPPERYENTTNHEPVLVSYSLGAVSSRYALAEMEDKHYNLSLNPNLNNPLFPHHRVKTWVSFEGEHQGCNIQLGFQYYNGVIALPAVAGILMLVGGATAGAGGIGLIAGIVAAIHLNQAMGGSNTAKQFLSYHRSQNLPNTFFNLSVAGPPGCHPLRSSLLNKLANLNTSNNLGVNAGYPFFPRLLSVANGSSNATQQPMYPGQMLFNLHTTTWIPLLASTLRLGTAYWALKNQANSPLFAFVIQQKFWWQNSWNTLKAVGVSADNPQEFDNSPGSWVSSRLLHDHTCNFWNNFSSDVFTGNCAPETFCPTVSALDLRDASGNPQSLLYNVESSNLMYINPTVKDQFGYPHINNPVNHKTITPFDAIFASTINEFHVEDKTRPIQEFQFGEIAPYALRLQNRTIGKYNNTIEPYKADFEARDSITAGEGVTYSTPEGKFVVEEQAEVTFRAGSKIVLRSGFKAVRGSKFRAYNQPYPDFCDSDPVARKGNNSSDADNGTNEEFTKPNTLQKEIKEEQIFPATQNNVSIYPNPNKGEFAVSSNNIVNSIEISNLLGEVVYASRPAVNQFSVDCSSYPKGIYFVKITTGESISLKKIIYQ